MAWQQSQTTTSMRRFIRSTDPSATFARVPKSQSYFSASEEYARLVIFGENLLALLVLAMGAALAFGNFMALVRPRSMDDVGEGELERPPLGRSLAMITVGLLAAVWALASLATDDGDPAPEAAAPIEDVTTY